MENRPYFLIPIEITTRELDYKLNIARYFATMGFNILIGNPAYIRDELKYKNYLGVFLEKGANPDPEYYHFLTKKGLYLYDLSDEGVADHPIYSLNYQPSVDSLLTMRKIFLWGGAQKDKLMAMNPNRDLEKKYLITGYPGFDLATPKYKKMYKEQKPEALPDSYILINTNFGCFQSHSIEEHLNACQKISPLSVQMIEDGYKREEGQFEVFKKWMDDIIQAFPSEIFVLRPHPVELIENYEKLFGHYDNVVISKAGNAVQAIASAKLVLHKDCSTAMQSYLMEIPVLSLGGSALSHDYAQWTLAFGALPETSQEAINLIDSVLVDGVWDPKMQREIDKRSQAVLSSHFYNIGNSTNELVEFITKDTQDLRRKFVPYKLQDSRSLVQKLKVFIRKHLPLHYKIPLATREVMHEFDKQDILKRLDLFEKIDPLVCEFKVSKIFPNTYKIKKI